MSIKSDAGIPASLANTHINSLVDSRLIQCENFLPPALLNLKKASFCIYIILIMFWGRDNELV